MGQRRNIFAEDLIIETMKKNNCYYNLIVQNVEKYKEIRKQSEKYKQTIIPAQIDELNGMIHLTNFSKLYFNNTLSWFNQKLKSTLELKEDDCFTSEEISTIASSYKNLAHLLIKYAEEIEQAKDIFTDKN